MCEIFNNYFHSTFTASDYTLPSIHELPSPPSQLSSVNLDPFKRFNIYTLLSNLDPTKACGSDELDAKLLKFCSVSLYEPISHTFNISLQCSVFPQEWKTHKICPIPKKGDLSNVQNYRPISLLCTMSKVFERAVYDQIISFIRPKIANCQFGFMQKRSCLTALLSSYNHIVNSIDNNKATDVDLQKAFDSVPHQELLFKLWSLGITGPLWLWFKSYLSNRTHYVSIGNSLSSQLQVLSGVPQGSVLGPLLFLIYINDLPTVIKYSPNFLFADDYKLMHSILTFNDSTLLQQDINSIMLWCSRSKLNINADKCAVLHFSLSVADSPTYTYKVNNHVLQFLDHYRDLGILVSTSLNWTLHYNHICSKAYLSLQLIRRIIPLNSSTSLKKLLYLSLVRSHLIYCSQLWRPHYIKDICRLEKIQHWATKFILNDYTSDYKSRLRVHLGIMRQGVLWDSFKNLLDNFLVHLSTTNYSLAVI